MPDEADRIYAACGPNALPTGWLRLLSDGPSARLQVLFKGPFGTLWANVPIVYCDMLPPQKDAERPSAD